ncbi:hypothetical protein [Thalassospira alkalitolerans]|uniref:Uncharacterized protein n=1 Tax=Thalassospira alkalitolerans TaxID=1293890 RepID=A0A1Y2L6C2_9PROT|nr:hypothetical protein [Thalassospira alkalitolerans]OSQ43764.1 hypothetical protein TALK_20155 [Thalassospira alkalitolerans]
MIATIKPPRDSFKQRHHTAAFAVLEQFANGLVEYAKQHDGSVSADKISKALAALREQDNLFDGAWMTLETDIDTVKARQNAAVRHDPFGRLLVSRFAHLLEGREAGDLEHGALSREILTPFFKVIRMMVGVDMLEEIDGEIHAIIDQHADEDDELRDPTDYWDHLAEEPQVANRLNLVFARMALHFKDYERRKQWMLQLVNDNLPHGDHGWVFTNEHCVRLLRALFRDVRAALPIPERAAELAAKLGGENVENLRNVMATLDRDVAAIHSREAANWE